MRAFNHRRFLNFVLLAVLGVIPAACGDAAQPAPERKGTVASALMSNGVPLGDFNGDGIVDGADSAAYVKSFGIKFATYGVTDDVYNTGDWLPRRTYDWQVFDISPTCLTSQYNIDPEIFPAEKLPNIIPMVQSFLQIPPQYLAELGRQGYTISLFESIGRLAKYWGGQANGYTMQMFFAHARFPLLLPGSPSQQFVPGYTGAARFADGAGPWSPWESLSSISFDASSGVVSFFRDGAAQWYTGTVSDDTNDGLAVGSLISGTFTQDGDPNIYEWSGTSGYKNGGTTFTGGDGVGATTDCDATSQTIGHTGPEIALNLSAGGANVSSPTAFNAVHEIGHTIADMIRNRNASFTDDDANAFAEAFPGPTACVADRTCPLEGSGYVDQYAASDDEDFAQTWAYLLMLPSNLDWRITTDLNLNGNQALAAKRAFICSRVYPC